MPGGCALLCLIFTRLRGKLLNSANRRKHCAGTGKGSTRIRFTVGLYLAASSCVFIFGGVRLCPASGMHGLSRASRVSKLSYS